MDPVTATIPLSGTVSGISDCSQGTPYAIWCPSVTSGDMFLQGSDDGVTSGNFVRAQQDPINVGPTASGDIRFRIGPGSCMVVLPTNYQYPSQLRLEMSTPQAAARSFKILYRPRMPQ